MLLAPVGRILLWSAASGIQQVADAAVRAALVVAGGGRGS
jgi:hypothetical protein